MFTRVAIALFVLFLQQLPELLHTPWFRRVSRLVERPDGHQLTLPTGFAINVFADGLSHARWMALAPNSAVARLRYEAGQTMAAGEPQAIVDLPPSSRRLRWVKAGGECRVPGTFSHPFI